jgi:glycosyl transferase family 25
MQIFVINLEKDIARKESIARQLGKLDLAYEIVPAVYGAALSAEERSKHYDDRKAKWHRARSLVPAEIGCALSHLNLYQQMIERGIEYALILEDDVVLPPDLGDFLEACVAHLVPEKPSVWLLSPAKGRATDAAPVSITSTHRLLPYRDGFYTSSYLLTLPAARSLLKELYPVGDVADCWKRMQRYKVVDLYAVAPPLIAQNQEEFGSSTTSDYHQTIRSDLFGKLTYKLRRARTIGLDLFYAPYRRWLRPYSGIQSQGRE